MARKKKNVDAVETHELMEDKLKAMDAVRKELSKRYGDGVLQSLGEAKNMDVDVIPTGSIGVDVAVGVGGLPRGRIVEVYGPESSGKTTLCLHVIAEAQKRGGLCAFIDMEHALDPKYAEVIGVDYDTLYVSQPDTGEQALEIAESLVRSGALDIVVVDSVAALVPRAEIEGEMGDSHVGLQARLMSQALRKLSGAVKQSNAIMMFTNQLREKVGVMFGCFAYDAPVVLADGTSAPIGDLVTQKRAVDVMSYDVQTHSFEPRPIANWYDNGTADTFLDFQVEGHDGRARRFRCTPNHLLLTEAGYVHAGELAVGQSLVSAVPALQPAGAPLPEAPAYTSAPMPIVAIDTVPDADDMRRFDIEVEGHHCYLVDGVVVHNSPETTSGGRALKFYASVRIDIRRIQSIKSGGDTIGNRTRVRIKKNKVAPPFRETEFDIMFNEGISKMGEILDIGTELDIIEKRGSFYRYNDGLLGQGRENSKTFLMENPEVSDEIEDLIRRHYGLPSLFDVEEEVEE